MNKRNLLLPVIAAAFLVSCGNTEKPAQAETEAPKAEEKKEVCTYSYNPDGTEVMWVAYKYTEKTGVSGVFESVEVTGAAEGNNPAEVLKNVAFNIQTESVNSGDPTRDPKIRESFFGTLENGDVLSGTVASVSGDETSGDITFNVSMNGMEQPVAGTYKVTGDKLEVEAKMNVETWKAMPAIQALNKVCEDLHKGADGKSILWPDVSLFLTAQLNKNCQ